MDILKKRWIYIINGFIVLLFMGCSLAWSIFVVPLETAFSWTRILKEFMLEDKKRDEELFKNQMPLSSFSSKISMCYYLGLISEYFYCKQIRRNICDKCAQFHIEVFSI